MLDGGSGASNLGQRGRDQGAADARGVVGGAGVWRRGRGRGRGRSVARRDQSQGLVDDGGGGGGRGLSGQGDGGQEESKSLGEVHVDVAVVWCRGVCLRFVYVRVRGMRIPKMVKSQKSEWSWEERKTTARVWGIKRMNGTEDRMKSEEGNEGEIRAGALD